LPNYHPQTPLLSLKITFEGGKLIVIVENLEPCPSPWLLKEYEYVASIFRESLLITNVRGSMAQALKSLQRRYGFRTSTSSVRDAVRELRIEKVVVLDPKAGEALKPEDLRACDAVVIGGIMGDHPPRGRTWELITSRLENPIPRNLGEGQLTIAGAAYVLKEVMSGKRLEELEFIDGLRLRLSMLGAEVVVELPYRFPAVGGKPVLPEGYVDVVARRSLFYESFEACSEG